MKYLVFITSALLSFSLYSAEMRCGWVVNPTPANIWLTDKDGDWVITSQGNHKIGIDEDSYDFLDKLSQDTDNYVYTNKGAGYGYSCACITVDVDKANKLIKKIYKAKQLLLKQCLEDSSIADKVPLS